jgi:hypothetical protein
MPAKKKTNLQLSKGTDSMEINLMQGDGELKIIFKEQNSVGSC